jgi:hypothetical protein
MKEFIILKILLLLFSVNEKLSDAGPLLQLYVVSSYTAILYTEREE